jgi:hypothetical protein
VGGVQKVRQNLSVTVLHEGKDSLAGPLEKKSTVPNQHHKSQQHIAHIFHRIRYNISNHRYDIIDHRPTHPQLPPYRTYSYPYPTMKLLLIKSMAVALFASVGVHAADEVPASNLRPAADRVSQSP